MKKLLKPLLALVLVVGFTNVAHAATIAHETIVPPANQWAYVNPVLTVGGFGGSTYFNQPNGTWTFNGTSTLQSLILYIGVLQEGGASQATSGTPYYFQVWKSNYNAGTQTATNCESTTTSPGALGLGNASNYSPNQALNDPGDFYRIIAFSGSDCDMTAWSYQSSNDYYFVKQIYPYGIDPLVSPVNYDSSNGWASFFFIASDEASTSVIYSYQNTIIGVATSSNSTYCNDTFNNGSIGSDFANGICNVAAFLVVPDSQSIQQFVQLWPSFQSRFPFSWFFDVQNILKTYTASSTDNFINLNVDFGSSTNSLGFSTLDVVSTTTLSKYLSDNNRGLMKQLMAVVFWLAGISFMYHEVKKSFHKHQ